MPARPQPQLSIGALAAATGIPADTIRTWERRYGFPAALRKPSGHRVYPLDTVPRLRRVAQAIARGHRAAEVVAAPDTALDALLAALPPAPLPIAPTIPSIRAEGVPPELAELLDATRAFDAARLKGSFQREWARLGPLEFLERRGAPFLVSLGDGWAAGKLEVRHEHFGSAVLGDFLRAVRLPLDERAGGPIVALTTLPGELHGIGLQMAALVFAQAGWRALVLGVETPVPQIAALAREAPISAVALSLVNPKSPAGAAVAALRRRVPRKVTILAGGAAAARISLPRGVVAVADLGALERWAREHAA